MRKKLVKYYLPMMLDSLIAWQQIGEYHNNADLVLKVPKELALPLDKHSFLIQLKQTLPRFEDVRNLVIIEVNAYVMMGKNKRFSSVKKKEAFIDYADITAVFSLSGDKRNQSYLQSLVPSIMIENQSFLNDDLSSQLVQWSEQRNGQLAAKKMLSLLGLDFPNSYLKGKLWLNALTVSSMSEPPDYDDENRVNLFLYHLFFYSRNTITSEFRYEDIGFMNDVAKILLMAIPKVTISNMGLHYKEMLSHLKTVHRNSTLPALIEVLDSHPNIKEGLKNYYHVDIFIAAVIFLKFKQLYLEQKEPDVFYTLIIDLQRIGCAEKTIVTALSWFAVLYGFIKLRRLYNDLKLFSPLFSHQVMINSKHDIEMEDSVDSINLIDEQLDKHIFLNEGKLSFYAVIKSGQYEVNKNKGKAYYLTDFEGVVELKQCFPDAKIKMKKALKYGEQNKRLADVKMSQISMFNDIELL